MAGLPESVLYAAPISCNLPIDAQFELTPMTENGLLDAVSVLDDLAAGRAPDRARLLAGAMALNTLQRAGGADRAILDAAAGLEAIATGGSLDLDETGRARASALAAAVRASIRLRRLGSGACPG
jgi:hypothetical protein